MRDKIRQKYCRKCPNWKCYDSKGFVECEESKIFTNSILTLTDDRWEVEERCDTCKGQGYTKCNCYERCNDKLACLDCSDGVSRGLGKVNRPATIQEILDGKATWKESK